MTEEFGNKNYKGYQADNSLVETEISRLDENYTDLIPFSDELRGTSQPQSAKI